MLIEINPASPTPIYEQLRNQIVLGIAAGKLEAGEALPSVRNLGADLGVNFHTVNKAYTMLCDEGYIIMNRRQGAVVAGRVPKDEKFSMKLANQILLTASEAICHDMTEDEFIKLCTDYYQKARGES
jgi:GntR family transcriptional regulator